MLMQLNFFFIMQCGAQSWYNNNWSSRKQITIDYTKVNSSGAPHSNFPVLINLNSDNDLASNARSDGFDILFTSSDGTTKLDYDRERYSSGTLVAWVKIPSLSASSNTIIYMYYGYSGASDQQSMNATWNSNYKAVWHLKESSNGTSNEFVESTSNAKHGTGQPGAGYSTQIDGKIGKAQDFANDRITIANPNFGLSTSVTFSFWQYGDAAVQPASHFLFYGSDASANRVASISCPYSDGTVYYDCGNSGGGSYDRISKAASASEYEGQWNYWVCTKNTSTGEMKLYHNGSLWHSGTSMTRTLSSFNNFDIGGAWNGGLYDGYIDEFRISDIALGSGWILTEYNNQNSPSSFYSVGTQVLPVELLYFDTKINKDQCILTWATASETDNEYFSIEKSKDGLYFETIAKVEGAGYSQQILRYLYTDSLLQKGDNYYRLKQTDYNGDFTYSDIKVVSYFYSSGTNNSIKVLPIPTSTNLWLEVNSESVMKTKYCILNAVGDLILEKEIILSRGPNINNIDLNSLKNGVYFIHIEGFENLNMKKFLILK